MDGILEWGIAFILYLQGLGEWLFGPMKFFTFLGNEYFFLFIAPATFWCWDAGLGLRLGLSLMVSGAVNFILKIPFRGPRPYWYNPRVRAFAAEWSLGVPSGHAQNAVVFWGLLAAFIKRWWAWIGAAVIAFLIGISRPILGVHFPHDVLVGWLVGALILWAVLAWEKRTLAWFQRFNPPQQVLLALCASLVLIALGLLAVASLGDWAVPQEWVENAARAYPEAPPIDPKSLSGLISNAGVFFGLAAGGIWLKVRGWFNAGGPAWQRIARFLVGLVGVFLIWWGLGEIFPDGESALPLALRYLRYTLVGVWVTGLAPVLFIRVGLAQRQMQEAS